MFTLTAKESILRAARKSDEMLEPYEWKRSRTVLRRERASNRPDLADYSRELLYEQVWKSGYYGEDNTVNVHVSNLRKKLAGADAGEEYIKTVWGIGFKMA